MGPFDKFLEEEGIIAQYTMPRISQQNGMAKRRNHILMDMVRVWLVILIFLYLLEWSIKDYIAYLKQDSIKGCI